MAVSATSAALDPSLIMDAADCPADPWQRDLLYAEDRQILINCSRQVGKSTTVSAKVVHQSILKPGSLSLLLAPSLRQSTELFRKVRSFIKAVDFLKITRDSVLTVEFENGSRIVALPGSEGTVRGFSAVDLLIVDEAAFVGDSLYRSVRPMLAVSQGQMICLTTPCGKRGFFYEEWIRPTSKAKKFSIPWTECPRIPADFVEDERRALGPFFGQEYECQFLDLVNSVFPAELIDRAFETGVDLDALGISSSVPLEAGDDEVEALAI